MVPGMALKSESAVGKKLSQLTSGSGAPLSQPDQFRNPDGRMAQRSLENTYCIEVPVRTQCRIEVIRHAFAGQIGNRLHAIKGKLEGLRPLGHSGGFHLDGDGSRIAQGSLLRGGRGNMVDGADGPRGSTRIPAR